MRIPRVTVALILLALIPTAARASTIVYEQLPGANSAAQLNSSTLDGLGASPGFTSADDFMLAGDVTITDVHWWGESVIGGDDFLFTFYADGGGIPGAVLHSTGGSLSKVAVNVGSLQDPVTFYESDVTSPFAASAGVIYWISIFNQARDAGWNWLAADDGGNGASQGTNPGPPWDRPAPDLAFQLTAVPEPAALSLLACGFAAAVVRHRRRVREP
jgi:hypothetical protein